MSKVCLGEQTFAQLRTGFRKHSLIIIVWKKTFLGDLFVPKKTFLDHHQAQDCHPFSGIILLCGKKKKERKRQTAGKGQICVYLCPCMYVYVGLCVHRCMCICVMYGLPVYLLVIWIACSHRYCHFPPEVSQHRCSLNFNFVQCAELCFYVRWSCLPNMSLLLLLL